MKNKIGKRKIKETQKGAWEQRRELIILFFSNLFIFVLIKRFYGEEVAALALVIIVLAEFIVGGYIIFKPKVRKRGQ